ncbi:MAG: 4Fe-4S dicluster domain-containing protein [Spirochaetaceae bacterium]|nr:MAG: 4Fe-4S dicluster domain-containing protein [Spirochaetaceae bacterium]
MNKKQAQDTRITKKYFLYFPKCETEKPIVYHLVKDYNLMVNIFRAKVTPEEEGYLVLDLTGTEGEIKCGIDFIRTFTVEVNESSIGVRWDKNLCTHCTNCLPHCPTHALDIPDRRNMEVKFFAEKCIECLACISNCPFGACTSVF